MRRPGRVVVAVTGAPSGVVVIRRAARIADRSGAQLVGVHVHRSAGEESSAAVLDEHRRILQALGATLHDVHAEDVVAGLVGFARQQGADQLVLGSTGRSRLAELLHGSVLNEVLRAAKRPMLILGRDALARACFEFLPHRAVLDVAGWEDSDIFAHS